MEKVKNLCIIQARMGSTRLPNKVLMEVNGMPLLEYEINRVKQAKKIDRIVIATGVNPANDKIRELAKSLKIDCFRGSENDVLARYYYCSLNYQEFENIVRITGDCPVVDPVVIDKVLEEFELGDYDYFCNIDQETYPDGMDVEVFKKKALEESFQGAKLFSEREHVTQYIRNNSKFKKGNLKAPQDFSDFRLTVDNQEDFEVISFVIKNSSFNASYLDYVSLLKKNSDILIKNKHIIRNEGLKKSLEQDKKI